MSGTFQIHSYAEEAGIVSGFVRGLAWVLFLASFGLMIAAILNGPTNTIFFSVLTMCICLFLVKALR